MAKTAFGRIEELKRFLRDKLLIKLERGTADELQRRVKILLQVAPDWQERAVKELTPDEEQKITELIDS